MHETHKEILLKNKDEKEEDIQSTKRALRS